MRVNEAISGSFETRLLFKKKKPCRADIAGKVFLRSRHGREQQYKP
jgi:hypothetical protein